MLPQEDPVEMGFLLHYSELVLTGQGATKVGAKGGDEKM